MADIYTKIADIFQSETFRDYAREQTTALNKFIQSGIMTRDARLDDLFNERSMIVEMPIWKPLSGDDEVLSDTKPLEVSNVEAARMLTSKLLRGKAFGFSDLSAMATGTEIDEGIANGLAEYWNERQQEVIISILKGLFAENGALAGTHLLDASDEVISSDIIIDGQAKLGDHQKKLTGIMMDSAVYTKLKKMQLIDTVQDATNPAVNFETYQDKVVFVDDTCPSADGVHSIFLFAQGALSYGAGVPKVKFKEYAITRDELAGQEAVVSRRAFIIHPNGCSYKGASITKTTTPTNTDLATANKWEKVYENKNIPLVCIKTRVEPEAEA